MFTNGRHSSHVRYVTREKGIRKVEEFKTRKSTENRWNCAVESVAVKINECQLLKILEIGIRKASCEVCERNIEVHNKIWKTGNITTEGGLLSDDGSLKSREN
uniref:Uncharacterized protein n=1 Tax=Pseudo-nitzschia australis TaxID=44445 RepID=A0A7S4ABY6_9STRA